MGVARTDHHFDYVGYRPVVEPTSRRPPFKQDPFWMVRKRTDFAKKLRAVLYGRPSSADLPFWGDRGRRLTTWGFQVRELEKMFFRYIEMIHEAMAYVAAHGAAEFPMGTESECLARDLDLMKGYQRWMYRRERELVPRNRRKDVSPAQIVAWNAKRRTEALLVHQICPLCGCGLPCQACGVPAFESDGEGGLRAKA